MFLCLPSQLRNRKLQCIAYSYTNLIIKPLQIVGVFLYLLMTKKHYKAIQWCFANDIFVSPMPRKSGIYIEIKEKNKKIISPNHYNQKELQKKIWELYLYLYLKYNHE